MDTLDVRDVLDRVDARLAAVALALRAASDGNGIDSDEAAGLRWIIAACRDDIARAAVGCAPDNGADHAVGARNGR